MCSAVAAIHATSRSVTGRTIDINRSRRTKIERESARGSETAPSLSLHRFRFPRRYIDRHLRDRAVFEGLRKNGLKWLPAIDHRGRAAKSVRQHEIG